MQGMSLLTCVFNVEWQPEKKRITDKFGKEQAQRIFNNSLQEQLEDNLWVGQLLIRSNNTVYIV